jgi:hypothetical protein
VRIATADGSLTFELHVRRGGVLVRRSELRRDRSRFDQSMLFASLQGFMDWCACERVRFDHPVIFVSLARNGRALFDVAR